jgi:hypothetical protein
LVEYSTALIQYDYTGASIFLVVVFVVGNLERLILRVFWRADGGLENVVASPDSNWAIATKIAAALTVADGGQQWQGMDLLLRLHFQVQAQRVVDEDVDVGSWWRGRQWLWVTAHVTFTHAFGDVLTASVVADPRHPAWSIAMHVAHHGADKLPAAGVLHQLATRVVRRGVEDGHDALPLARQRSGPSHQDSEIVLEGYGKSFLVAV